MGFSFKGKGVKIMAVMVLLAVAVFSGTYLFVDRQTHAQDLARESATVQQVDPVEVCMVNDAVMGKPQIPVEFEGKTYYGCCEGCVARIKGDRTVRYAVDPVTGSEVDKAKAFITTAPDGAAMYFESRETAERYYALINAK